MPRIVALGMSNTDLVCRTPRLPVAGETVAGSSFSTFAGGKGANQAVAAARSGATVAFFGAAGDDTYGADRRRDLKAEGIDTSGLQTVAGATSGVALIVVDDAGENQIVTVAGANADVDPDLLERQVGHLKNDLAMLTWELSPETSLRFLRCVSRERPVVLNLAPFHDSVSSVFPDDRLIVICNEVEAGQLLRRPVEVDHAVDAAREIARLGCRGAIITIGSRGAVGAAGDTTWSHLPPDVNVVDTTSAGDSFCGAFAAWLGAGASLDEATRSGVHAGALATTVAGAQPSIPTREQILNSMRDAGVA